jgi:endoglucanase
MDFNRDQFLHSVLSQPTAPFREGHVISRITEELRAASVPYFLDPVSNIVIGVSSKTEYQRVIRKKTTEPLRVFIAHMDHPGFHGVQWKSPVELEVQWHGGSPTQDLDGSQVWLGHTDGTVGTGKLRNTVLLSSGKAIQSATVVLEGNLSQQYDPKSLYGGFKFRSPIWKEKDIYYTKAADDLVGCYAITTLAIEHWKKRKKKKASEIPFIGLLTRAEEVGFIGAIGHFELGWLNSAQRPVLCISLETSRTLPGAEIGKGPVVRLGDRMTVFDPGALRVFTDLAESVLPGKYQRRIMDGGSCEASAATAYGFPCVGISVPLGNYHNQNFEGGPDSSSHPNGPAPEFVHSHDIEGLLILCQALLQPKQPWATPWNGKLKDFKKSFKNYRSLLRSNP